ncbi:hypothetical protein M885DRAFT_531397 [Pelagophyceae sp. CCMP2097]|nr:hypothetical protein M885DRAFT_531397 [Pelagophyceae sp. CCMP2097]
MPRAARARIFGPAISEIWGAGSSGGRRKSKKQKRSRGDAIEDEISAELGGAAAAAKPRKRHRPKHLPPKMSAEVAALLGEAHDAIVGGQDDRAIQLLGEVVRLAPESPDAYATLSALYESRPAATDADLNRANQLALVAAHLAPRDAPSWRRVAELSLELATRAADNDAVVGEDCGSRAQHEATALDALAKVLELDPKDAAAAADRAALHASTGAPLDAADELQAFVARRREQLGEASPDEIALQLVLAENAKLVGRRDVARTALRRALEEANKWALGNEDDSKRHHAALQDTRSRAAVELATLEYEDARYEVALEILRSATLVEEEDDAADDAAAEPLDVATLRGAAEARLGNPAAASDAWWPLVRNARALAQATTTAAAARNSDGGGLDDELADAHHQLTKLLETVVDVSFDVAHADLDSVVSAALDALARLHAASGDANAEADAHARLGVYLRERGGAVSAKRRIDRALATAPRHLVALRELAATSDDFKGLCAAFDALCDDSAAADSAAAAADDARGAADKELLAWTELCLTLARLLRRAPSAGAAAAAGDVPAPGGQRGRIARRLGAVAFAIVAAIGPAEEHRVAALGAAAVRIAPRRRRAADAAASRFAAARAAWEAECAPADLRAKRRAEAIAQHADVRVCGRAQASLLEGCIDALHALGRGPAAEAMLADVHAIIDASPSPLTHAFASSAAVVRNEAADVEAPHLAAIRVLAASASTLATKPTSKSAAISFSRALHACASPTAGVQAMHAARHISRALDICAQDEALGGALAAAHEADPRRALALLVAKPPLVGDTPVVRLARAAALVDCASKATRAQGAVNAARGSRHVAVLGAFAQLGAYARRRPRHEVEYNVGRFFEALGLPHLAAPHYFAVLGLVRDANVAVDASLARPAAHNLLQIFQRDGARPPKHVRALIDAALTI